MLRLGAVESGGVFRLGANEPGGVLRLSTDWSGGVSPTLASFVAPRHFRAALPRQRTTRSALDDRCPCPLTVSRRRVAYRVLVPSELVAARFRKREFLACDQIRSGMSVTPSTLNEIKGEKTTLKGNFR